MQKDVIKHFKLFYEGLIYIMTFMDIFIHIY